MHDALFAAPEKLIDEVLFASVSAAVDDPVQFRARMDRNERAIIDRDISEAKRLKVVSTPTFLLGTTDPGGQVRLVRQLVGTQDAEVFENAIDEIVK
jgi:protein-disulfide isomerase